MELNRHHNCLDRNPFQISIQHIQTDQFFRQPFQFPFGVSSSEVRAARSQVGSFLCCIAWARCPAAMLLLLDYSHYWCAVEQQLEQNELRRCQAWRIRRVRLVRKVLDILVSPSSGDPSLQHFPTTSCFCISLLIDSIPERQQVHLHCLWINQTINYLTLAPPVWTSLYSLVICFHAFKQKKKI